jgi:hypothetical protein
MAFDREIRDTNNIVNRAQLFTMLERTAYFVLVAWVVIRVVEKFL